MNPAPPVIRIGTLAIMLSFQKIGEPTHGLSDAGLVNFGALVWMRVVDVASFRFGILATDT